MNKYKRGTMIGHFNDLTVALVDPHEDFIWFNERPIHKAMVRNWSFNLLMKHVIAGRFYQAELNRKEGK